jgi:hypothetical protein
MERGIPTDEEFRDVEGSGKMKVIFGLKRLVLGELLLWFPGSWSAYDNEKKLQGLM